MARASVTDLARRSSFDTTRVSPWAHGGEGLALGVQVLAAGGPARVSDERCRHGGSVRIGSRLRNCHPTIHMRRSWLGSGGVGGDGLGRPLDDPLLRTAPRLPG